MAVLKKSAGLGGGESLNVDELAESYVLLMTVTRFLEAEDEGKNGKKEGRTAFT